jgi:hypothetical protein
VPTLRPSPRDLGDVPDIPVDESFLDHPQITEDGDEEERKRRMIGKDNTTQMRRETCDPSKQSTLSDRDLRTQRATRAIG